MLAQDYFDEILGFQIAPKETASMTAMRLWNLIEKIPRTEMAEDVKTGFVASVLCQKDSTIRRELYSHNISTRAQLLRVLNGISHKRKLENSGGYDGDTKKARHVDTRFNGTCHRCGIPGHRAIDCRKHQEGSTLRSKTTEPSTRTSDKSRITCYVCGQTGHVASTCAERKGENGTATTKEVHICEHKSTRSTLNTESGELVSFLFDSGSACSLVTNSIPKKFPGILYSDVVYLSGIGKDSIICNSQIRSRVHIQNITLTLLFHIVPDGTINDEVIVGRDLLENG